MNSEPPKPASPGFTTLSDTKKLLRELKPPINAENRQAFLATLSQSRHPRQWAFRLLALLATDQAGQLEKVLSCLQEDLTGVLAGGPDVPAEFPGTVVNSTISVWINQQFPSVATKAEAELFLETEKHLWILYQILRWWKNTHLFVAAISCYADELEALTVAESGGRKRRQTKRKGGFVSVVDALIKRVPAKPNSIAWLIDNLRLCRAWAGISAELQERLQDTSGYNTRLKAQLEGEHSEREAQKMEIDRLAAIEKHTQTLLSEAQKTVASLHETLQIQAGAHEAEKGGLAVDTLARVRSKLLPELEHIRLYADRTEPNTAAIVRKVQELTQFITDLERSK